MSSPTWKNRPHTFASRLATGLLGLFGWKAVLAPTPHNKFVAVFAPHTSNWDFFPGIMWRWATRTPAHWIAKDSLFRGPLDPIFRSWGGIPIARDVAGSKFIRAVVNMIAERDEVMLCIAPEGTRSYVDHWKNGFYLIARSARVPIGVIAVDWGKKQFGVVGYVELSGNIDADMQQIARLLEGVRGRCPQNAAPVTARSAKQ